MAVQEAPNLRQAIVDGFDAAELRAFCFDLGVDPQNLTGPDASKPELAEALLRDVLKRDALAELRNKLTAGRPERTDWQTLSVPTLAADNRDPYNVDGLPNPFLGLRLFTYDDRSAYAGRDTEIGEAVRKLTTPGQQRSLLFITGASGSGKSSFAQAGVVPALEAYYAKRNLTVRRGVFRPALHPMAMLADALAQAGVPDINALKQSLAGARDVIVLVVDQFEEAFTQANAAERDAFFAWLSMLPPFDQRNMHVLVTMRSDYLDELHEVDVLWQAQLAGSIPLHAMREDVLKLAIQRPVQAHFPAADKRLEPALVDALARDAAAGASLLPLLQVTLEDLWKKGRMTLAAYNGLSDAITRRANQVLEFKDHDGAYPSIKRDSKERDAVLEIFLNLVNVSMDDDPRRDVRVGRLKSDLMQGAPEAALISGLVDDLARARLIAVDGGDAGETVNIVHESLIRDWDVLRDSVRRTRQRLQQRARFEQQMRDWKQDAGKSDEYLLTGVRLAQAIELDRTRDVAVQSTDARNFLQASRKAADRQQTTARRRRYAIAAVIISVLALGLAAVYASWRDALARRVAAASLRVASTQPDLALVLAEQASRDAISLPGEVREGLLAGSQRVSEQLIVFLSGHTDRAWDVAYSHDKASPRLASVGDDGRLFIWDPVKHTQLHVLTAPDPNTSLYSVAYAPDDSVLAAGDGNGNLILWDTATLTNPRVLKRHDANVLSITFDGSGKKLLSGGTDGRTIVTDVASGAVITLCPTLHKDWIWSVAFSPDGRVAASGGRSGAIVLWDIQPDSSAVTVTQVLTQFGGNVTSVAFAEAGGKTLLASGNVAGRLVVRDTSAWRANKTAPPIVYNLEQALDSIIWGLAFSPNGDKLLATGNSAWMQIWRVDPTRAQTAALLTKITPFMHGLSRSALRGEFSPDGNTFATAGFTGLVGLWQVGPGSAFVGHESKVISAHFAPETGLQSIGEDAALARWDVAAHSLIQTVTLQSPQPLNLSVAAFDRAGTVIAAASKNELRVWDMRGAPLLDTTTPSLNGLYTGTLNDLAFSMTGDLVTVDANGQLALWDLKAKQLKTQTTVPVGQLYVLAFSPDGRWVATGGCRSPNNNIRGNSCGRGEVRLWNASTLEPAADLPGVVVPAKSGAVSALAFDAATKRLAIGSVDGTVTVWDLSRWSSANYVNPRDGAVTRLAFSPASDELAVATGGSNFVTLYNLSNNQPAGSVFGEHRGDIRDLFYPPDGAALYSTSNDGFVMRWDLDIDHWRTRMCRMANRNLTRDEWSLYIGDPFFRKTCPAIP